MQVVDVILRIGKVTWLSLVSIMLLSLQYYS